MKREPRVLGVRCDGDGSVVVSIALEGIKNYPVEEWRPTPLQALTLLENLARSIAHSLNYRKGTT